MNLRAFTLAVIAGLLVAETRTSQRHTERLRALGAIEPTGDIYAVMAVLYPLAFLAMGAEGLWRAAHAGSPTDARNLTAGAWYAAGLLMFATSKGLKYWAIRELGERWTFRVMVLPGMPLVTTGPYRYVAHPNYVAVVGELVGTAMMMQAVLAGPVMVVMFGIVLLMRIRFENRMLRA